ncbi:MAG: hypothetical protein AAB011_12155 [Candidatus Eisenbacteria bacterium]
MNHDAIVAGEFRRALGTAGKRAGDGSEEEHLRGGIFLGMSGGAESQDVVRML